MLSLGTKKRTLFSGINATTKDSRHFKTPFRVTLMPQANRVEIPRGVRQPLLGPSPVFVLAGDCKALIEVDAVFVIQSRRDAIQDGPRCARVLIRLKENISGISLSAPHPPSAAQ